MNNNGVDYNTRIGRFTDSVWLVALNRIIVPLFIAAAIPTGAYLMNRIETVGVLSQEVQNLSKINNSLETQVSNQLQSLSFLSTQLAMHTQKLEDLRENVVPRIDKLETKAEAAATDASATRTKVDTFKDDMNELKLLARQNLNVSQGHDADIKATRNAVAPQATIPRN